MSHASWIVMGLLTFLIGLWVHRIRLGHLKELDRLTPHSAVHSCEVLVSLIGQGRFLRDAFWVVSAAIWMTYLAKLYFK